MKAVRTSLSGKATISLRIISAFALALCAACGENPDSHDELARRARPPKPAPAPASTQNLRTIAERAVVDAITLSSDAINSEPETQQSSTPRRGQKTTGSGSVAYSFDCPGGGTASATGTKTKTGDGQTYTSQTTANVTFDDCASTDPLYALDGAVDYSRQYSLSEVERTAAVSLNGSLTSTSCSVIYDNLSVVRYVNFQTGEYKHEVTGSTIASCAGSTPSPSSSSSSSSTSSSGNPYPSPTSSPAGTQVTITCTFDQVVVDSLNQTIDLHCEITS